MEYDRDIQSFIEHAPSRALATWSGESVNVVPVSVVRIVPAGIQLFDFFMGKTRENLKHSPRVALACWSGFAGVQVKGVVTYESEGADFENAQAWALHQFPDRTLYGLITLVPDECFDLSVGGATIPEAGG